MCIFILLRFDHSRNKSFYCARAFWRQKTECVLFTSPNRARKKKGRARVCVKQRHDVLQEGKIVRVEICDLNGIVAGARWVFQKLVRFSLPASRGSADGNGFLDRKVIRVWADSFELNPFKLQWRKRPLFATALSWKACAALRQMGDHISVYDSEAIRCIGCSGNWREHFFPPGSKTRKRSGVICWGSRCYGNEVLRTCRQEDR